MLQNIKIEQKMRLDELLKYVWENPELFNSQSKVSFYTEDGSSEITLLNDEGDFETDFYIRKDDRFIVGWN